MIFSSKNKRKILVLLPTILLLVFSFNVAQANTLTDDISIVFNFINKHIIAQIKQDFCRNYILSISNGEWKEGELRTNIGERVCTSYAVPHPDKDKIKPTDVQHIDGSNSIEQVQTPKNISINNPKPDVYVPGAAGSGADLNINQIISLTNSERKGVDSSLVNLRADNTLKNIATIRVRDMFALQYFEHNSPTGDNASKEADRNGYSYITIGENIALGNFGSSQGLLTAWMNSPGHRANILNKNYTEIGVYAEEGYYNGQKVWIAAQIFGKPLAGCNEADASLKNKISSYELSANNMLANINRIDAEMKTLVSSDVEAYNSKVSERNALAGLYNNLASEIKKLVAEYNKEVAAFNLCIKTL